MNTISNEILENKIENKDDINNNSILKEKLFLANQDNNESDKNYNLLIKQSKELSINDNEESDEDKYDLLNYLRELEGSYEKKIRDIELVDCESSDVI